MALTLPTRATSLPVAVLTVALVIQCLLSHPALASDPMVARQLTDRAIEAQSAGDQARALILFDEALEVLDHPKIRYFRGKSLLALDRRDEALAEFRRLVGVAEVEKYAVEIASFIRAIEREEEVAELAEALDREKAARARAERERKAAEARTEETAIKVLASRRSGLLPPPESRMRLGPVSARLVPTEPFFSAPSEAELDAMASASVQGHLDRFDSYSATRSAAAVLTGVAVAAIGTGAALAFGPFGEDNRQTMQIAGLTTGIVGAIMAIAGAAIWPGTPDSGLRPDPLAGRGRP